MTQKTALITGASSGIGACIAEKLAEDGIHVWINYANSKTAAEKIAARINDNGGRAACIQANVGDAASVSDMMTEIEAVSGKLDYLVNNAGVFFTGSFKDFNPDEWKKLIETNLVGKFNVLQAAIPLLQKSSSASIVNISSRLSKQALSGVSASCCASAGIVMLTQTAALELAEDNIRVNAVCAGATNTPMLSNSHDDKEVMEKISQTPNKRIAEPADIANSVLFLLSDKASHINGSSLFVDGGSSLGVS